MIKTIVVPTDGSAHAKLAIELAAEMAQKFGARMVILHVLLRHASEYELEALCTENKMPEALAKKFEELRENYLKIVTLYYEGGPTPIFLPDEILTEAGNLLLENARRQAESKGVKEIVTHTVDGAPADKIVAVAEKEDADMIVMGSRGLGNVAGIVMGSVSHKVNHLFKRTCVLVK
jgi:nucleotide-binding universal stress UspA family protein